MSTFQQNNVQDIDMLIRLNDTYTDSTTITDPSKFKGLTLKDEKLLIEYSKFVKKYCKVIDQIKLQKEDKNTTVFTKLR